MEPSAPTPTTGTVLTFRNVGILIADQGQEASGQIVLDQPGDDAIVDLVGRGAGGLLIHTRA